VSATKSEQAQQRLKERCEVLQPTVHDCRIDKSCSNLFNELTSRALQPGLEQLIGHAPEKPLIEAFQGSTQFVSGIRFGAFGRFPYHESALSRSRHDLRRMAHAFEFLQDGLQPAWPHKQYLVRQPANDLGREFFAGE
jgi:hypothetical protein